MSFRFIIDTMTLLSEFLNVSVLSFFKMVRIMRIDEVLSRANLPLKLKTMLNLMKYTFYLLLYLHLLGCLWLHHTVTIVVIHKVVWRRRFND